MLRDAPGREPNGFKHRLIVSRSIVSRFTASRRTASRLSPRYLPSGIWVMCQKSPTPQGV